MPPLILIVEDEVILADSIAIYRCSENELEIQDWRP